MIAKTCTEEVCKNIDEEENEWHGSVGLKAKGEVGMLLQQHTSPFALSPTGNMGDVKAVFIKLRTNDK